MRSSSVLTALLGLALAALGAGCAADRSDGDAADDGDGERAEEALTEPMPNLNGADRKVYPTNKDRDLACPVVSTRVDGYQRGSADLSRVEIDTDKLRDVVPEAFRVAVVLVRRVGGVPHYRYLSNGTHDVVYQPWSSTKWIAAVNAGARLRAASDGEVGLTSETRGIPLGDMITGIENYKAKVSSSNGLSRFMHDIGGRARANALVTEWLGRTGESFGGNYGEAAPELPMTFTEPDGARASIDKDRATGYQNQLSALTEVELLRRVVMHREEEATRVPGLQWSDLRVLFYGAESSKWYPGQWGGMSADKAIYLQSGLDMARVEADARGKWRIFSKVGFGVPTDARRGNGELVEVGYACLPKLDGSGAPFPDQGRELFVAAMLGTGGRNLNERDKLFAAYHARIVQKALDGSLD